MSSRASCPEPPSSIASAYVPMIDAWQCAGNYYSYFPGPKLPAQKRLLKFKHWVSRCRRHSEKQNFRSFSQKKQNKKTQSTNYMMKFLGSKWEKHSSDWSTQQGMCWPPAWERQGEAHLEPQVETSTRHRLCLISLAAALWTLPASSYSTELLFMEGSTIAAVPGSPLMALDQNWDEVSFPARDEKSQWRSPIGPNGVIGSPSEAISVANSVWFYDWLPCSGGYIAPHVTSGSGFVIEKEAVEMATQIWTLEESWSQWSP